MNETTRDNRRRLFALDGGAVETDRSRARAHNAGDGAIERRFADAVRAEHGDDLAVGDAKINAAQYFGIAVAGAQIVDFQERGGGAQWA